MNLQQNEAKVKQMGSLSETVVQHSETAEPRDRKPARRPEPRQGHSPAAGEWAWEEGVACSS
jgi:hypothetical protein